MFMLTTLPDEVILKDMGQIYFILSSSAIYINDKQTYRNDFIRIEETRSVVFGTKSVC